MNDILPKLEQAFKKCSDCSLHDDYKVFLNKLYDIPLTEDLVEYLCDKATSKKHWVEIRSKHLVILLLNESSRKYDLKQFYFDCQKRCRSLWYKLYFIRGYAMYASEDEMIPVMEKYESLLQRNHYYIDYSYILSRPLLPYLVKTYGYDCCERALETAKKEYEKIDPLLRGWSTLNERFEYVELLSKAEWEARYEEYCIKKFGEKPRLN